MSPEIIYEDKSLIVVKKPSGIPTQTRELTKQDMVSILKNHLGNNPYLGVIHRLDQPVEGLLLFAKNKQAAAKLSAQVSGEHSGIEKQYLAFVYGEIERDEDIYEDYLLKEAKGNLSKVTNSKSEGSYSALKIKVLEVKDQYSKVRIQLMTGRHHQIRVQLSSRGHAILGDQKYGNEESIKLSAQIGLKQIALCADSLEFIHPVTGNKMHFCMEPTWEKVN